MDQWTPSPHEVTGDDWRDYMGKKEQAQPRDEEQCMAGLTYRRYQRAYLDLFEDKLVDDGYDWKATLNRFLFTGKEPLIHSITAGRKYALSEITASGRLT